MEVKQNEKESLEKLQPRLAWQSGVRSHPFRVTMTAMADGI